VHLAPWPSPGELPSGDPAVLAATSEALRQVRRAKSAAKVSMRAEVERAAVHGPADLLARADLCAAGHIRDLSVQPADGIRVEVALAP
jgi:valyl-tRNA synthetase